MKSQEHPPQRGLTLAEAANGIGRTVVYYPSHSGAPRSEQGVITSVNEWYVFVRYGANPGSAATNPNDLRFTA